MRRLIVSFCATVAVALAAPAFAPAQDPVTPLPSAEATVDDGVLEPDEVPPATTPEPPTSEDCSTNGADADYAYCNGCRQSGTDADYEFCAAAGGGAHPAQARPAAQVRRVVVSRLPYTAGDPLALALVGVAFLLGGAGLRLTLSSGARPPRP